jgi:hypothetical protein
VSVGPFSEALNKNFIFSRDDRPVDGLLEELTLSKISKKENLYSANFKTEFINRHTGKAEQDIENISASFPCSFKYKENSIAEITCVADDRMVDGALVELIIKLNDHSTYNVVLHTNFYDRINHKEADEVKTIASELKINR